MSLLQGIRVIDLSRLLPGPFCTLLFADYGAEVIRVEQPGVGDVVRGNTGLSGPMSARFHYLNRGKQSVAIDLKRLEGQALLLELVKGADVLMEQFRPGVMARMGLEYSAVARVNPGIVYCSISGYGQDGPLRNCPGHDLNYLARSGLLDMSGPPGGPPIQPGAPLVDIAVGTTAAWAVMAALWERQRSGRGQYIDLAMLDVSMIWGAGYASEYLAEGKVPVRGLTRHGGGDPRYAVYAAKGGGHLSLAAREPHLWRGFCQGVGHPEWERMGTDPALWDRLRTEMEALFAAATRQEWTERLTSVETCFAPVLPIDEAFAQPQAVQRQMVRSMPTPDGGSMPTMGYPARFSRSEPAALRAAPYLGQQTGDVLSRLGLSREQMAELTRQGVIGGATGEGEGSQC